MHRFLLLPLLALVACTPANPPAEPPAARDTAAAAADADWRHGGMVTAANPHAVRAAAEMLRRGGHAVDAAIAAHAVLGLVEPESSGLGGSAFMLVFQRGNGDIVLYDGRETAPAGATPDMFIVDGQPLGFREAWQTGLSVGVPGTVALYRAAHEAHGRLPWADLFQPAIELARDGFEVTPKLHNWLVRLASMISPEASPAAHAYLYPDGEPLPAGYVRDNPAYAETLARIAAEGSDAFYKGELAEAMAARAQQPPMPGTLTAADLAGYTVATRDPVCGAFRDGRLCSAPPPSSGIAQVMIADLYDRLLAGSNPDRDERIRAFVDAQRLAYADRDRYVADPAFVSVPVDALLDPDYLAARASQRAAPGESPEAGDVTMVEGAGSARHYGADGTAEAPGTSHLSIVDTDGNAVSMTASVGAPFGSLRWTAGFLLNNEMSDFSRAPTERGVEVANAVAPGKRPRSSMSPTMLFDSDGNLRMVTGSPGGNSIVAYIAKSVVAVEDWGLSAQEAADYPNIIARGDTVRVENTEPPGQAIADALAAAGYDVQESEGENSGLHLIVVRDDGLDGAADKRREGEVARVQ
ncbi:MAG: gamma-glutamyltransferase [Woeseiaceae bacterium]|nr:gamma-glutamyltransferase [Woeseiaceae bacterium]